MRVYPSILVVCTAFLLLKDVSGLTFAGCFTLAPGLHAGPSVTKLGWTDAWQLDDLTITFCVHHCVQKQQQYAGMVTVSGGKPTCVCGSERSYTQLGTPDHRQGKQACTHKTWAMSTYVATGDISSQYIGCYKEVTDAKNMASSSHNWIDGWMMTSNICIRYCEANGAAFANLRNGDTCTCGRGFAKHGVASESLCDKSCAGSKGKRCGGALANSVYSTLSVADILNPGSRINSHSFIGPDAVKVPVTQTLMRNLFNLQQAIKNQVPSQDIKKTGDLIFKAKTLVQSVADMRDPLQGLINSRGFGMSNAGEARKIFSGKVAPEIQPFADVIKRAHSFIDVDVKKLVDFVNSIRALSGPLKSAADETLPALQAYIANGVSIAGLDKTIQIARMMVSASNDCLPRLNTKKNEMISNMEGVSQALVEGPAGTKHYINVLKNPLYATSFATAVAPTVNPKLWQVSLTEIANMWTGFVSKNGVQLYGLLLNSYNVQCPVTNPNSAVGKRSTCKDGTETVSFSELVNRPGDNEAKTDMQKFVTENKAVFLDKFKWDGFTGRLDKIYGDFQSVQQFLKKTGISASGIRALKGPLRSVNFHRTCLDRLSTMITSVCHTSETPNDAKVIPGLKC